MSRKPSKNRVVANELCMTDSKGIVRALITLDSAGSPMLQFCDSDGRPRLDLMLDGDGDPHLMMWSKNQCVLGIGYSSREQSTGITMWGGPDGAAWSIEVDSDGIAERSYTAEPTRRKAKRRK
jgi:hypothetical protein